MLNKETKKNDFHTSHMSFYTSQINLNWTSLMSFYTSQINLNWTSENKIQVARNQFP